MLYPQSIHDNLLFRLDVLKNCTQDLNKRAAFLTFIQRDIEHFFNLCLWTYDPRKSLKQQPFILYPFQKEFVHELNEAIDTGADALTEKSRDMGVTWCVLGVFLYRWMFKNENFLIGSRKDDLVDKIGDMESLFERLRFMIHNLPWWVLPAGFDPQKHIGYEKIFNPATGAAIIGESANANFSRQGRQNAIMLDEFAFWDFADSVWQACGDSTKCRLPVSTPKGKRNKFAELRFSGKVKVLSFHWSRHPEKNTAWYEEQKLRRSEREVAEELDLSYITSAGKPFYSGFNGGLHVAKVKANTHKPLILGWDYGYHHPVCVICQQDVKGRLILLDTVFGEDEIIDDFGERVKIHLNQAFSGFPHTSYGDPAGEQESDKSKKTSADILTTKGFYVQSLPSNTANTNYIARQNIIEQKLKTLIDGVPAFVINDCPRNQIIIEAFEGGYHYPDPNKAGAVSDQPVKEGYYEHPMNALEYVMVNLYRVNESRPRYERKEVVAVMDNI